MPEQSTSAEEIEDFGSATSSSVEGAPHKRAKGEDGVERERKSKKDKKEKQIPKLKTCWF